MTASLSADPWTMLGVALLALIAYGLLMLPFYALLYAHGEREGTYIPVEVEQ